ncbi:hypothetical protein GVAV_003464 [Gurleya vavrai]
MFKQNILELCNDFFTEKLNILLLKHNIITFDTDYKPKTEFSIINRKIVIFYCCKKLFLHFCKNLIKNETTSDSNDFFYETATILDMIILLLVEELIEKKYDEKFAEITNSFNDNDTNTFITQFEDTKILICKIAVDLLIFSNMILENGNIYKALLPFFERKFLLKNCSYLNVFNKNYKFDHFICNNYQLSIELVEKIALLNLLPMQVFEIIFKNKIYDSITDLKMIFFIKNCYKYLKYKEKIVFEVIPCSTNDYRIPYTTYNFNSLDTKRIVDNFLKERAENAIFVLDPLIEIMIIKLHIASEQKQTCLNSNDGNFYFLNDKIDNLDLNNPGQYNLDIKSLKESFPLIINVFLNENNEIYEKFGSIIEEKDIFGKLKKQITSIKTLLETKLIHDKLYFVEKTLKNKDIEDIFEKIAKILGFYIIPNTKRNFCLKIIKFYKIFIRSLKDSKKFDFLKVKKQNYDIEYIFSLIEKFNQENLQK